MRVSDEKLHVEQQSGAGLQAHGQGQERTKLQYAGLSGVRYGKMGHLIAERSHRLARYPVSSAVPLRRRKVSAERNSVDSRLLRRQHMGRGMQSSCCESKAHWRGSRCFTEPAGKRAACTEACLKWTPALPRRTS